METRYEIRGRTKDGRDDRLFKSGKTYKRRGTAENQKNRFQQVFDAELYVAEVKIEPKRCPHCKLVIEDVEQEGK